jgi:hypothetical protein
LFETPLQPRESVESNLEMKDVVGVLTAALELLNERSTELNKLRRWVKLIPQPLKHIFKRLF